MILGLLSPISLLTLTSHFYEIIVNSLMLYSLIRLLFRITFKCFFRKTFNRHPERLPLTGPVIMCANHPGALLDPIVVAASSKRRVYFLAKAAAFKGKLAKWLLPKFNMIPIYRKQDDPTQMHKNDETFAKCYDHLLAGDAILIFPEGVSITERKLKEIKTGAARIALGACAASGFKTQVKIACLGINYDDPHLFRQDVLINYSEPIVANDYQEIYERNPLEAVNTLTAEIRKRLENGLIHIEREEADGITRQVEKLFRAEIVGDSILTVELKTRELEVIKNISLAVNYYLQHDRETVNDIVNKIKSYFWKLDELGINDKLIRTGRKQGSRYYYWLGEVALLLLGFPFFLYGIIINLVPFRLATYLSRNLIKQRDFAGAIGASTGMLLFLIWYSCLTVVLVKLSLVWWLVLAIAASWIPAGLWAWYYSRSVVYISKRWKYITVFRNRTQMMNDIILQRREIISEFVKIAEDLRAKGVVPAIGKSIS